MALSVKLVGFVLHQQSSQGTFQRPTDNHKEGHKVLLVHDGFFFFFLISPFKNNFSKLSGYVFDSFIFRHRILFFVQNMPTAFKKSTATLSN